MLFMFNNSKFNGDISNWNIVKYAYNIKLKNYNRAEHLEYLKINHPEYFFF